jgi:uncharacterized damage-inducible protein DinB
MLAFDLYRHWETELRPTTLTALRKLTPEQLACKPSQVYTSAWELAVHMVETEWTWIYRNALKRVPWETAWDAERFASLHDLLNFWHEIHMVTVEWLTDSPVTELRRQYPMPSVTVPMAPMNWLIYHVMEHEIHHRGQLFMLMRMQGINPPKI